MANEGALFLDVKFFAADIDPSITLQLIEHGAVLHPLASEELTHIIATSGEFEQYSNNTDVHVVSVLVPCS